MSGNLSLSVGDRTFPLSINGTIIPIDIGKVPRNIGWKTVIARVIKQINTGLISDDGQSDNNGTVRIILPGKDQEKIQPYEVKSVLIHLQNNGIGGYDLYGQPLKRPVLGEEAFIDQNGMLPRPLNPNYPGVIESSGIPPKRNINFFD